MSFSLGKELKIEVEGASHSEKITVRIEGLPKGRIINMDEVYKLLERRSGGRASYTTARKEKDTPVLVSGLTGKSDGECGNDYEYVTTGDVLEAYFVNSNVRRQDYGQQREGFIPRPSHADFAAYTKYKGNIDLSGGGFFSGRMTLPMCFAGAIAKQLLEEEGILIGAHILSVKDIRDDAFNPVDEDMEFVSEYGLPLINPEIEADMEKLMTDIAAEGDSIGGVIECKITGLPIGLGDPIYDSVESSISYGMFGIPAVKGIEFGAGFGITNLKGSEANDDFIIKDGQVKCETNNSGGIQGGITNGMPIVFRTAIKPTPSIYKEQKSVDLITMEEKTLKIEGRHDACIVPRAVPCVEAMAALVIYNLLEELIEE